MRAVGVAVITSTLLAASAVVVAGESEPPSRPPILSAGCGSTEAGAGTQPGLSLVPGEREHTWLYVPEAYDGSRPLPLWLQLHGVGGSGLGQIDRRKLDAEEEGFVLVAPNASFGNAGWTWREDDIALDASRANPDIAFIEAGLDRVVAEVCIDLARVYVAGESGGGEGASVIGCVLEDRIAAVAPVVGMLDVGDACELDRPVPYLGVHGRMDDVLHFDGGASPRLNGFPVRQALAQTSIPERVANVALRNGCEPEPAIEAIDERTERWSWSCPPGAEVELIVHGGGHQAPSRAWKMIWEFFEQHPMPE